MEFEPLSDEISANMMEAHSLEGRGRSSLTEDRKKVMKLMTPVISAGALPKTV